MLHVLPPVGWTPQAFLGRESGEVKIDEFPGSIELPDENGAKIVCHR
jgi:hypothetical protein